METIMKNPDAPVRVGVKKTTGYVHNSYEVVTHVHDDDPTMVEYIRADVHEALLAEERRKAMRMAGLREVGKAAPMPGAHGFTMGAFTVEKVPVGASLFTKEGL